MLSCRLGQAPFSRNLAFSRCSTRFSIPDGEMRVDVRLDQETVWLTQRQMSELFGRDRSVVTRHIRNIFREEELDPEATCAKFAQVQFEGARAVSRSASGPVEAAFLRLFRR